MMLFYPAITTESMQSSKLAGNCYSEHGPATSGVVGVAQPSIPGYPVEVAVLRPQQGAGSVSIRSPAAWRHQSTGTGDTGAQRRPNGEVVPDKSVFLYGRQMLSLLAFSNTGGRRFVDDIARAKPVNVEFTWLYLDLTLIALARHDPEGEVFLYVSPVIEAVQDVNRCLACSYALVPTRVAPALVPQPLRIRGGSAARARYAASLKAFEATMKSLGYEYQSDFARRYYGQGKAEGNAEGRAEGRMDLILKLLALRFGPLTATARARIRGAQDAQLDALAERMLTAKTLEEAVTQLF